jgi:hypothetical protein
MLEKAEAVGQAIFLNAVVYILGENNLATYASAGRQNTATYLPPQYLASYHGS